MNIKQIVLLMLFLVLAAIFRFTGLNWDSDAHLHPDERFLTMVTTNTAWPASVRQYFDTDTSPLNPHNKDFSFFVYGTYPMHLAKLVATVLKQHSYNGITIVGRTISGFVDLITLLFVFLIARYLVSTNTRNTKQGTNAGLLAAFLYACMVLPIQLSHFYTVDPFVTLFTTIVLWRLLRGRLGLITGIALAFAVGAKISAVIVLPVVTLSYILSAPWHGKAKPIIKKRIRHLADGVLMGIGFLLTLRIVYPYLFRGFTLNPRVLSNWKQLSSFDGPATSFPPGLQWISVPVWQPTVDLLVWGLGIPMGLLAIAAVFWHIRSWIHSKKWHPELLLVLWIVIILTYQSLQFAKSMRYLWPAYPAIAVLVGLFVSSCIRTYKLFFRTSIGTLVGLAGLVGLIIWPLSYLSIYLHPNTRVRATQWIYEHVPSKSAIAWEHWDDPLPFGLGDHTPQQYKQPQIPSFDPDSPEKWRKVSSALAGSDYLVISSNRTYGAIGRARKRFPQTVAYYEKLFSGSLGFIQDSQFTSRPTLPIPGIHICLPVPGYSYGSVTATLTDCAADGIRIIDDYADESFTVYDHPKVLIFRNDKHLSAAELFTLLQ